MKKILDLGCGKKKRAGAIGVDFNSRINVDVVHDLNEFPYPFEDQEFEEIYLDNTLEHLDNVIRVMEEVHRICMPGGQVKVIVPYFRSIWACIDPTHKHFFTVDSMAYFDPQHSIAKRYDYTEARFHIEHIVFNETLESSKFKKLIVLLANKYPHRYERYLSHLYPLDDITYYLKKS
jgi:ubiquinone/menaquinone biosynthesis C-methylase UbiE